MATWHRVATHVINCNVLLKTAQMKMKKHIKYNVMLKWWQTRTSCEYKKSISLHETSLYMTHSDHFLHLVFITYNFHNSTAWERWTSISARKSNQYFVQCNVAIYNFYCLCGFQWESNSHLWLKTSALPLSYGNLFFLFQFFIIFHVFRFSCTLAVTNINVCISS